MHSLNYSDGLNTIDEIVQYVDKIWLKKIAITDHSQFELDSDHLTFKNWRSSLKKRKNVYNDVDVIFGVEGDLINDEWDCCFNIQWIESDFCILSCHYFIYQWDLKNITQAYTNAIERYHDKIKFIWHICDINTSEYLDVEAIAKVLNKYQIPIEFNCSYLDSKKLDLEKLNRLLHLVEAGVYVNSDMHTLNNFSLRQSGFDYLHAQWLK